MSRFDRFVKDGAFVDLFCGCVCFGWVDILFMFRLAR